MLTHLFTVVLLWATLVIEHARPDVLPVGSIFLPAVVLRILWCRNALGLLVAGMFLVVDWVTRPAALPVVPILLPLATTLLATSTDNANEFSERRSLLQRIPNLLQPTILVALAIVARGITGLWDLQFDTAHMVRTAVLALPLSLLVGIVSRAADDFGLRRSAHTMRF